MRVQIAKHSFLCAAIIWLLVFVHQQYTHGVTTVNEQMMLFGMTWMDSGKFLPIAIVFLMMGVADLRSSKSRVVSIGKGIALVSLACIFMGTLSEFLFFPWGSYEVAFEESQPASIGGIVQAFSILVFTGGCILLSFNFPFRTIKGKLLKLTLIAGSITMFFMTPVSMMPALCWILIWFMSLNKPSALAN